MPQNNRYELKGRLLLAVDGTDQTVDLGPIRIPLAVSFQKPGPTYRQGGDQARAAHPAGKGDQFRRERGIDIGTTEIPIVKAIDDLPDEQGSVIAGFFGYDGKD